MNEAIARTHGTGEFNERSDECTSLILPTTFSELRQEAMKTVRFMFGLVITILIFSVLLSPSQGISITMPLSRDSASNQVPDFYAGGMSDGYTLRISPQGGTMSAGDYLTIDWMPWGYVTAQWSIGKVYIIFLANVTQTDFRIGFLYLTNSSTMPFLLRWYDYGTNALSSWNFQGTQQIYNRTVATSSVAMPQLKIAAASQTDSGVSVLGPNLHLGSSSGEWLNGTDHFSIYPVYTQFYSDPTDYNEVWSLLVDETGNYYFAILYLPNNDNSRVIIEHQLRLNDYRRANGIWVGAKWQKGTFDSTLTVRTPFPNSFVKVDGFPLQTNLLGILSTTVPSGRLTVDVPNEIQDSPNSKMAFTGWNKFGTLDPLNLILNSTLDVTAKYQRQYFVAVNSQYASTNATGWYAQDANVTFSVPKLLDLGNGTRRVFVRWDGISNSTSPNGWALADSAKTVNAVWKTQVALSISAPGMDPNASIDLLVGNDHVQLNGSTPYTEWVDAYQQLSITVQNHNITSSNGNYMFSQLRADNQTFGGVLIPTQPTTVWLMYNQVPSSAPAINMQSSTAQPKPTGTDAYASTMGLTLSSSGIALFTQGLLSHLNRVPYLSSLIGLTMMLVNLGTLLAAPYGPPITGFFIGSIFVGFLYVFPVTALVLLYRSAKTKRQPRSLKLLPLAITWAASLAIVIIGSSVNALQSFIWVSEMLLVLSNALLFPLLAAYRVARLAA
jgi:hypothetical protein